MSAATALVILCLACSDLGPATGTTLPSADLLPVGLAAEAPPPGTASFYVGNARPTTYRLVHPDAFNSLYVELAFPAGGLASLNGIVLDPTDSVRVTVTPEPAGYGLTLQPAGLAFVPNAVPTARFVLAAYGDLSVADGSATYANQAEYASALTLWKEIGIDLWERVAGSGFVAGDAVTGKISAPGRFRVAAPR